MRRPDKHDTAAAGVGVAAGGYYGARKPFADRKAFHAEQGAKVDQAAAQQKQAGTRVRNARAVVQAQEIKARGLEAKSGQKGRLWNWANKGKVRRARLNADMTKAAWSDGGVKVGKWVKNKRGAAAVSEGRAAHAAQKAAANASLAAQNAKAPPMAKDLMKRAGKFGAIGGGLALAGGLALRRRNEFGSGEPVTLFRNPDQPTPMGTILMTQLCDPFTGQPVTSVSSGIQTTELDRWANIGKGVAIAGGGLTGFGLGVLGRQAYERRKKKKRLKKRPKTRNLSANEAVTYLRKQSPTERVIEDAGAVGIGAGAGYGVYRGVSHLYPKTEAAKAEIANAEKEASKLNKKASGQLRKSILQSEKKLADAERSAASTKNALASQSKDYERSKRAATRAKTKLRGMVKTHPQATPPERKLIGRRLLDPESSSGKEWRKQRKARLEGNRSRSAALSRKHASEAAARRASETLASAKKSYKSTAAKARAIYEGAEKKVSGISKGARSKVLAQGRSYGKIGGIGAAALISAGLLASNAKFRRNERK